MAATDTSNYWRAVAMLGYAREEGLRALEESFSLGRNPGLLDGAYSGRLLAVTAGAHKRVSSIFEGAARLWMPWLGKTFDSARKDGHNLFSTGGARLTRFRFPNYSGIKRESGSQYSAFRFLASVGASGIGGAANVLRIDYRDVVENPRQIRHVLDEVVEVDAGVYLGQALVERQGAFERGAWFVLER